jgi:hypothetical protein
MRLLCVRLAAASSRERHSHTHVRQNSLIMLFKPEANFDGRFRAIRRRDDSYHFGRNLPPRISIELRGGGLPRMNAIDEALADINLSC